MVTKITSTANTPLWLMLITEGNNDFYLGVNEKGDANGFSSKLMDLLPTPHRPQVKSSYTRRELLRLCRPYIQRHLVDMWLFRWWVF